MKLKYRMLCILTCTLLFSLASCKTKPPVKEPDPEPVVEEVLAPTADELAKLDKAKASAEAARLTAIDVDAQELAEKDWNEAEELINRAHTTSLKAKEDAEICLETTSTYNKAEKKYQDAYATALPLFVESSRERLGRARELAVEAGASVLYPTQLDLGDGIAEKAFALWDEGEKDASVPKILDARDAYFSLTSASTAVAKRSRIEKEGGKEDDPENFLLGIEKLQQYEPAYSEGGMKAARDIADEALLRFNMALNKTLLRLVGIKSREAEEEKIEAEKVKAKVATKELWNRAIDAFTAGETEVSAEHYDAALENFGEAGELFIQSREEALAKRAKAVQAIEAAEAAIKASDEKAAEAEEILGGTN